MVAVPATLMCLVQAAEVVLPGGPLPSVEVSLTKPATAWIVAPPEYRREAERLRAHLSRIGRVEVPVKMPGEVGPAERGGRTLVVLGNLMTNPLAAELYRLRRVISDASRPGAGGYEIRTVYDPWLAGTNVVFCGGSDPAGVALAVDKLLELVTAEPLPRLLDVRLNGAAPTATKATPEELAGIAKLPFRDAGGVAQSAGMRLFWADDPGCHDRFLAAMRRLGSMVAQRQEVDDLRSMVYLAGIWEAIEEGFSADERRQVTGVLLDVARKMPWAGELQTFGGLPAGNHWDARASDNLAAYFRRRYRLEVGHLGRNADAFFAHQATAWKCREDCPGYGSITYWDLAHHLLLSDDRSWLDSGRLRQAADYLLLISDNRGALGGFGDYSDLDGYYYRQNLLNVAATLLQDGRYRIFSDRCEPKRGAENLGNAWETGLPAKVPTDLLGVAVAPVDEWVVALKDEDLGTVSSRRELLAAKPLPDRAKLFDKVSLRPGFEPTDPYLLLGGISHGYHAHPDGGAIIQYSDRGRLWLFDHGYFVPDQPEHNSVVVLRDGLAEPLPRFPALTGKLDSPVGAVVRCRTEDYNGTDWDRTILWLKPRTFVVIDDVTAREPATVGAQCVWRVLGSVEPTEPLHRFTARQAGQVFRFASSTPAVWKWLSTQPPAGDRHSLREVLSAELEAGAKLSFVNAFTSGNGAEGEGLALSTAGARVARLTDGATTWLVGRGACQAGTTRLDADAYAVGPTALVASGLTGLTAGGLSLAGQPTADLWADARRLTVVAGRLRMGDATLTEGQSAPLPVDLAKVAAALTEGGPATLTTTAREALPEGGLKPLWQRELAREDRVATYRDEAGRELPDLAKAGTAKYWEPGSAGCSPAAATDNDERNYCAVPSKDPNATQVPKDLGVEWGAPVTIAQMEVVYHSPGYEPAPDGHHLEVWTDGAWRRLEAEVEVTDQVNWRYRFAPVTTTRARLMVTKFSAMRTAIYHLRLFAAPVTRVEETRRQRRETVAMALPKFGDRPATALLTADLLACWDADGKPLFEVPLERRGRAMAVLRRPGGEVLVVSTGRALAAYDGAGKKLWEVPAPLDAYTPDIAPAQGDLNVLRAVDLNGDGWDELAAASTNWFAYAFDGDGKLLWRALNWAHPSNDIGVGDLNGDGRPELSYATSYNDANVFSAEGKLLARVAAGYHSAPQRTLIGDFAGRLAVAGSRVGGLVAVDANSQQRYALDLGARVTCLTRVEHDGHGLLAAGSENFHLYGVAGDGSIRWLKMVGDVPRDLVSFAGGLAAVLDGGGVLLLQADGTPTAGFRAPGPGLAIATRDGRLVVATADGQVCALAAERSTPR